MKTIFTLSALLFLLASPAVACEVRTSDATYLNGTLLADGICDAAGNRKVTANTTAAGEDISNDTQKVEQRFALLNVTADTAVKSAPGFLHHAVCSSDAAATAGTIIFYDNTAESGTVLHTFTVAAQYYAPFVIPFDGAFAVGLYIGYTTTNDVNCTVSYR